MSHNYVTLGQEYNIMKIKNNSRGDKTPYLIFETEPWESQTSIAKLENTIICYNERTDHVGE